MMDAGTPTDAGIVELDETYVGGKPRRGDPPRKRGRGTTKYPVFVAVQRGGQVRATTVDDVKFATMKPLLDKWLHGDAWVMTDEFSAYQNLGKFWKWHFRVEHGAGEFSRGSVNRRRTVAKLGRVHRRVADCRRDHMHKATRALVDRYEGFAVETLNIKGLMKTRMGKSFADAGLGEFLRVLRYKSEWAGRQWLTLPAFTRSTGVCPDCGAVGPKLSLSIREWTCAVCGAVHDRDVAAARTILARCQDQQQVGRASPEPAQFELKRGFAVDVGVDLYESIRHYGPPTNVLTARESAPLSKG